VPVLDLSPAAWISDEVDGFALGVRSLVPDRFEAYGRILHPVGRICSYAEYSAPDFRMPESEPALHWADIAAQTGRKIHPRVQFDSLIGAPREADRRYEAEIGTLDSDLYDALCGLLKEHTSTPRRCWFCVWEGYGQIQGHPAAAKFYVGATAPPDAEPVPPAFDREVMEGPRVSVPGRDYFLLEGELQGWEAYFDAGWDSPNLFWPDDKAWCVATEIDLDSTYVGGSQELIDALLVDDRFETVPAHPDDPVDTTGDNVNGPVVSED
jgi:hypothetical protein